MTQNGHSQQVRKENFTVVSERYNRKVGHSTRQHQTKKKTVPALGKKILRMVINEVFIASNVPNFIYHLLQLAGMSLQMQLTLPGNKPKEDM